MSKKSVPLVHRDTANPGQTRFNEETTDAIRRLSSSPGRLVGAPRLLTTTGTFAPTAGTTSLWVECVGGGGGGGGAQFSSPNGANGGGGGGGSYAGKWFTTTGKTFSYTIGAGGAGGSTAGGNGSNGSSTTFSDGVTTITACGGAAAAGMAATAGTAVTAGGSYLGTSSNGDVMIDGGPGGPGIHVATTTGISGQGGNSVFGGGGGGRVTNGAGIAGGQYGGGGGGASAQSAGQVGGAGATGCILIWEFS